mmetsp:Transcript_7265/g.9200  ORF Transcript_7265/g.9200 Transcript_7265/m.9200 type:complete len:153 (-) Transcript_7265:139-597(-)
MHIPKISTDLCPSKLLARSISSDVTSTADAFKSWDTCMDNKTCKIVAIVGIVLASLICIWILSTLIQCICLGKTCLESLCMCCCRPANRQRVVVEQQVPYANPNMYPTPAPYYAREPPAVYGGNRGYIPVDGNSEKANPFEEKHTSYRGYRS